MEIEELKIKRNIIEAKEYCTKVDSNLSYYKTAIFKNEFEKTYIEEYYPLYLYFLKKHSHLNYSFRLLADNSDIDGLIYNELDNIHKRIQITCASINNDSVKQHEMLIKEGVAPGIGKFERIDGKIVASRILRNVETAISEVSNQIVSALLKKESKKYDRIDVLLISYHFRLKSTIENWNLLILDEIKKLIVIKKLIITFSEIYLVEEDGFVDNFIY